MIKNKYIDYICLGALLISTIIALIFINGEQLGIKKYHSNPQYASRLFDDNKVHQIDIQVDDWNSFIKQADKKEYISSTIVIDGETFEHVGLRAKGNNSLSLIKEYGLSRYSLKLEFDHFLNNGNYYGLDKLSLDASFQDNSYLKNYIAYDMMSFLNVPSPLCSYVWVTVNQQDWGLFLAIEEPEEAFLKRNYGNQYGKLYKPDYQSYKDKNSDLALKYIDDYIKSYPNIFDHAKVKVSKEDKKRLIHSLKILDEGENLDEVIYIDEVLSYFAAQVFVMNWDSYIGYTGHNYYLYEKDGMISLLPWDYNLAFGTYALGMDNPETDPTVLINFPINTPAEGSVMLNRPLYHNLMKHEDYLQQYHKKFQILLEDYFQNGYFLSKVDKKIKMISPYVKKDPTSFCSYEDFHLAVQTLKEMINLRCQSIQQQLSGMQPITIKERSENPHHYLDASHIRIEDLGDFDDLKISKRKQDEILENFKK